MALLADLVLTVHFLVAGFITLGFVVIPLGPALGWRWVRLRWLRLAHLGGILFVAAEAALGVVCPLTAWEDALRGGAAQEAGFIARWLRWALYYEVPLWVFETIYLAAAALALLLWRWVPPFARRRPA